MRGILWRWLFFFGTILWISLCLADYHKKYLQKNLKQTLKSMEIRIDPPAPPLYQIVPQQRKLQPPKPALTFWKFLSIVFSVSAIVIIKRLSTFRKKSLPGASCSDFDLIRAPYGSFISRVPPIHQEFQVARMETNFNSGDSRPPALGVKIVQKKLEDLENNIATLKQRISSNSASNPGSAASDSIKKVFQQKLAANQSYFSPAISNNTDTHSTLSSNSPLPSETMIRKEILLNHSRPITAASVSVIPTVPSIHNSEKNLTPDTLSRNTSISNCSTKEVKFNQNTFELENDIISLKELKDSMSGKSSSYGTRKIFSMNFEESYENAKKELLPKELKSNPISLVGSNLSSKHLSKRNSSMNSRKETKYQTSESKTNSDSKTNSTTFPSISSRRSLEGSSKSFPVDLTSSAKMFTDTNTTTSTLTSIRKKRFLKSMKNRKKELKNLSPMSTSIATYLAPNFQPSSFPRSRHRNDHHGSYAAINRKKAHTMKDLRANAAKTSGYDQISVSSSNDSTDSIDKFVAKIMKPDSDATFMKNSSDEMSMASTSISSLAASSSTFISGGNPKFDSVTNSIQSIRSILPLSRTTVSTFSSLGHSRNMPAGAGPLSSGESIAEKKSVSKYKTNLAIHSLAMNYLQTLERKKFESDSQEKMRDSGSDFSFTTKSVLEKYKSKTKDNSATSSHQNILEDKYWLLHW